MSWMYRLWIGIADFFLLLLILLCLSNTSLVVYLLGQARGQLRIVLKAQPVADVLNSTLLSEEQRGNLLLIQNVKEFSEKKLGFMPSSAYKKYFDQQGKTLLWIVTACEAFELNDYKWKFPFLGAVSYKGFFDSLQAVSECSSLKVKGYDVEISPVSAWSTLGFFSDPVFSSMLQKQKGELAELIFHELFHGTIYVSGQVDLNENLAEFIAEKATLVFFNSDKTNLSDYKMHKAKQNEISYFATSCLERLRQVYRSMEERKLSKRDKMQIKDSLYRVFESEIGANETMEHLQRRKILNRMQSGKNAFFMHFNRYEGLRDSLETVFRVRHGGSLPDLIKSLKITCKSF